MRPTSFVSLLSSPACHVLTGPMALPGPAADELTIRPQPSEMLTSISTRKKQSISSRASFASLIATQCVLVKCLCYELGHYPSHRTEPERRTKNGKKKICCIRCLDDDELKAVHAFTASYIAQPTKEKLTNKRADGRCDFYAQILIGGQCTYRSFKYEKE